MFTSFPAITCQVWNYTWPLLSIGEECESNHTVEWPTQCVFECAYGYLLVGSDTATCQLDGTLDADEPPGCIREYGESSSEIGRKLETIHVCTFVHNHFVLDIQVHFLNKMGR